MTIEEALEILEHLVKKADCLKCQYFIYCVDDTKDYCVQALETIKKEHSQ